MSQRKVNLNKALARAKRCGQLSNLDFEVASVHVADEFNVPEKKRKQLVGFLQKKIIDLKNKEFKNVIDPEYPKIARKDTSHGDMLTFADALPTTEIDKYVQKDIIYRTGMKKQLEVYSDTAASVTLEFRNLYLEVTHATGVNSRVRPLDGSETHFTLKPYQYFGKTEHYDIYLANRERIKKYLFIQYPLMQKILKCSTILPPILIDISKFREAENEIPTIMAVFEEEVAEGAKLIKKFHFAVSKVARTFKNEVPQTPRAKAQYLRTGTGILASCIDRLLRNTILQIINITGDGNRIPFLKLNLGYDHGLILSPTAEETTQMYAKLLRTISNSANELLALESIMYEGSDEYYIPIYIQEQFLEECIERIRSNIQEFYIPVYEYVTKLESSFASLYPESEDQKDSEQDLEISFEDGCKQIDFYMNLMDEIEEIVTNEYYAIGAVEQEDCRANLKMSIYNLIEDIAAKLVLQHEWENEDICEVFQKLTERALEIPKNSQELMDQGVYMTWAKTVLVPQLTERIQNMLVVICRLTDITTITYDHMQLNCRTVHWIWNIKPILEKNSSMYEAYKYDFEEALANAVVKINADIQDIIPFLTMLDSMDNSDNAREYVHQLAGILVKIRSCEQQKILINKEEATFKYPISSFLELEDLKTWIYQFYHLVKLCMNWNRSFFAWMDGPFEFLDAVLAEEQLEEFFKELLKIQKYYRNKLRQMATENNAKTFQGSVEDPDPLNQPAPIQLTRKVMQQLKDFRPALQLMGIMCNSALLQRHWDDMSEIAGFDITPDAGTTLRKLTEIDLGPSYEPYEIISTGAVKELQLITALRKMIAEWDDVKFKTSAYKDSGAMILTALDDVQVILDDHIMKTLTMRGSIFVKPYEAQVKAWYEKITRMNATIDEWGKVQSQWLYLLPIFSSKDIVMQMPAEGILFREVDSTYKRYMQVVAKDPRVIESAGAVGLLEAMQMCTQNLEKINDGVTSYLEKKRLFFPRFFFLSNDEMLEILSETKDPLRVQPHLRKCFEAINKLEFDGRLQIHAMMSQENEKIDFMRIIKTEEAGGSVEKWLIQVEEQMLSSMRNQIFESWTDYCNKPRTQWMQDWPGQIVLCVSQIYWTANCQTILGPESTSTLQELSDILKSELQDTVELIRDPNLTNLQRITIKALIVIDVHAKDVVYEMYQQNVLHENEFKWLAQLRYYWEDEVCQVRIINATVKYACEYLGNSDRLVITPLTDRCYRTLIGAYHLHLNGAPEGPAGTGKNGNDEGFGQGLGRAVRGFQLL